MTVRVKEAMYIAMFVTFPFVFIKKNKIKIVLG